MTQRVQEIPPRTTKEEYFWFIMPKKPKKIYKKKEVKEIHNISLVETEEQKEIVNNNLFVVISVAKKKKKRNSSIKSLSRMKAREKKNAVKHCESCLYSDKDLEVHHIDSNPLNNDIWNLVKLCVVCHYEIHKDEPVWKIMYSRLVKKWFITNS